MPNNPLTAIVYDQVFQNRLAVKFQKNRQPCEELKILRILHYNSASMF